MKKREENRNKNSKALEKFAEGAGGDRTKKKETLDRFTMAMRPQIKEAVRALAWHERVSQREIIEQAFKETYPLESKKVKQAIAKFSEHNR
jgi:hypothetical protein